VGKDKVESEATVVGAKVKDLNLLETTLYFEKGRLIRIDNASQLCQNMPKTYVFPCRRPSRSDISDICTG
jgi:hypothetical protein